MKTKGVLILVINTGSTSTKLAVFKDEDELCSESLEYGREQLGQYASALDQTDMRKQGVLAFIQKYGYIPGDFDVIASRGGAFGVFEGGGYLIDDNVLDLARNPRPGFTPSGSWPAALIAGALSQEYGIPAYFYNAVRMDEFCDYARYSGLSFIKRVPGCHPLNTKEVARRVAAQRGREYEDCSFLVCHMGGGISVEMHVRGRLIDNLCSDEGAFTPERAGRVPADYLVDLCFSGQYTQQELIALFRGKGGLVEYLGTSDLREVQQRIQQGDRYAEEVIAVMAYMVAKDIGALATTANGEIDNIIFTGGIAHSAYFTNLVRKRVEWIAPVVTVPGSFEMEALAHGILRITRGEEKAKRYSPGN